MRERFTKKYRRTLDLHSTDDKRVDAGTLLTFLREHVSEHLEDQVHPWPFHLDADGVPPTAFVAFDAHGVTLSWTDQDVTSFNQSIDDARAAKERATADNAQVTVVDGAADTV